MILRSFVYKTQFLNRCTGPVKWGPKARLEMCERMLNLTPAKLADIINKKIEKTFSSDSSNTRRTIYIATPPSQLDYINKVSQLLSAKVNFLNNFV